MIILVLKAYCLLLQFDLLIIRNDFQSMYSKVRDHSIRKISCRNDVNRICHAVDIACIWYWKEVLCLQRSATTTYLLKDCGVRAEMVIGAQQVPFRAHAWAEVDGHVVNDKPYVTDKYVVLDRC